jgi:hypothetical protein
LCQSFVFVGALFGTFLFAFLTDHIGRKRSIALAWLSATIGIEKII